MKRILPLVFLAASSGYASAFALMLDFGATPVGSTYATLSPGHSSGQISNTQVSWNTISSSSPTSTLIRGDGSNAAGVTLTMGQEATGGSNAISFSTPITSIGLVGNGGLIDNRKNLLTSGSIYGDDTNSSTVGRDGFFGSGAAGSTGAAVGLRLDGLGEGEYLVYVMARNTNTNPASLPMNVYAGTGMVAGSFNFSALQAHTQSNLSYASAGYTDGYSNFVDGENYVGVNVNIGSGESLFLAIDGVSATDRRGFINMVQIVQIPEPSAALLGCLGILAMLRRRR